MNPNFQGSISTKPTLESLGESAKNVVASATNGLSKFYEGRKQKIEDPNKVEVKASYDY